jgi:hypothetical protein
LSESRFLDLRTLGIFLNARGPLELPLAAANWDGLTQVGAAVRGLQSRSKDVVDQKILPIDHKTSSSA